MTARIHIIHDDPAAFAAMARLLRERGHVVNTGAHDPLPPDLVLCGARQLDAAGLPGPRRGALVLLSEAGEALPGTGFDGYIGLPIEPGSFAEEVEAFLPAAAPALLLVDDDAFMREVLADMLEQQGWRVLAAPSGEQALVLLAREAVALVVSDHVMPGMTGAELLARTQRLYPRTVRVLLSGQGDDHDIVEALRSGAADRFYAKPWQGAALVAALREALALARRRAGANV